MKQNERKKWFCICNFLPLRKYINKVLLSNMTDYVYYLSVSNIFFLNFNYNIFEQLIHQSNWTNGVIDKCRVNPTLTDRCNQQ